MLFRTFAVHITLAPMGPHRVNIINTLQLLASVEAQLEYQQRAPGVNVANEVVNQWFCDFYHPGSPEFESQFSQPELASLAEFNRLYDERVDSLPNSLSDLVKCVAWLEVVKWAHEVLVANGWSRVAASYGS